MKRVSNIVWGVILIFIGIIIGLNTLKITDINLFFDGWWTLFIIVSCAIGLFTDNEKVSSLIGLMIGTLLLLSCQNIIDFSIIWKLLFPIILVIIGLSMIFKNNFNRDINTKMKNAKNSSDGCCATFSTQELSYDNETFKETNLTAVFGGVTCDLRNAKINSDVYIYTCSVFGGIDLLVPEGVNVKYRSTSIFGGVDYKNKKAGKECKHTIYIDATCIFGGLDIK